MLHPGVKFFTPKSVHCYYDFWQYLRVSRSQPPIRDGHIIDGMKFWGARRDRRGRTLEPLPFLVKCAYYLLKS